MEYFMNENGVMMIGGVNLKGEPIKKTKISHPYSYDEYVLWQGDKVENMTKTIYADRMRGWDLAKYNEACVKVWGKQIQIFDMVSPEEVEQFLRLYVGEEIELKAVTESCNIATGYPIFAFHY